MGIRGSKCLRFSESLQRLGRRLLRFLTRVFLVLPLCSEEWGLGAGSNIFRHVKQKRDFAKKVTSDVTQQTSKRKPQAMTSKKSQKT